MEPSPAAGGSETTRLVSPRDGGAGGSLRLKSLFTEPSEPVPEESKPVEMPFHHCHRDPLPPLGLTPERLHARRQLYAACAVCFVFMAGEVVGGYLAHSLAIMTDAAHLLADVGSMMGSLFSLWLSTRPATRTMTFGWHRSETLGALASVVSLWMVTGILLYLAFVRLLHSDYHIEGGAMLLTASIAVCANLFLNTRQLTPSAPSSSPSVPLDPRLPPSETFFESSWKVRPAMWGSNLCGIHCCQCQASGQPMSCTCGPLRSLTTLPLHTWPLTPLLTLKPSWLKPHPVSTPGLDSPAVPCRSSSTSQRWPSACVAGSLPKPEPWSCPHPTARPRLSPGLSASAVLITETGPNQAHAPFSLLPSTCQFPQPQPQPHPQWARPKCGGEWGGSQGNRCHQFRDRVSRASVWQGVLKAHSALSPWSGATNILFLQSICLCGRLAGWLGASACLCAVGVPMPGGGQ
ncbi:putative proton-coupled zinc antiporter SLC30A3 isoform X2 [Callithrix jacchus]|uniref:probable proton-coupled zinc antiporter SLC30A3 isoform X2 n=2 Tax=Callithrix jacchus TaxID=9483 RepID=UPI00083FC97E|nr:probable proton-coupled zinc antiporter SLC30A3 isoform X2 [Callithrix jacchus]